MKKLISFILAFVLCLGSIPTFANVTGYYDDKKTALENAVTYYPAIELLTSLGAKIELDGKDFTATFNEHVLSFDTYYETLTINDQSYYEGDDFVMINNQLHLPLSLLKETLSIGYDETHEVRVLSAKASEAKKDKEQKRFETRYPKLTKALKDIENTSFEQILVVDMKVKDVITQDEDMLADLKSLDEMPRIKLKSEIGQDVKNDAYKFDITLETNEFGSTDKEEHEIIILKNSVFKKEDNGWYEESRADMDIPDLNLSILPYFMSNSDKIKKERLKGGTAYTIELQETSISTLIDMLGEAYVEAMDLDSIDDADKVSLKDFKWTIVVDHKNQLQSNNVSTILTMYDEWSDTSMILSVDVNGTYTVNNDLVIESPLAAFEAKNEVDLTSSFNLLYNDADFTKKLDLKMLDHTLMINVKQLSYLIEDVKVDSNNNYTVSISTPDKKIEYTSDSDAVIVGNNQYVALADTLYDNNYYVPLKLTIELLGGACLIDGPLNKISFYSPKYLSDTYLVSKDNTLKALENSIKKFDTTSYKTSKNIYFEIKDYVEIIADYYSDDYNFEATKIDEVQLHDPINKYSTRDRTISSVEDEDDFYQAHLLSYKDNLYYAVQYAENDELSWYMNEDVPYNELSHSEMKKFNTVKPLLKVDSKDKEKVFLTLSNENPTDLEKIVMSRLVHDEFLLDYLYQFPLEALSIKSLDMTYLLDDAGMIETLNEDYVFEFHDGKTSFDLILTFETSYSDYGKQIEVIIPHLAE